MPLHKFNVLNRFSGDIQFTAEIDCSETALPRIKLGLAVKWADLRGAVLRGAVLSGADLRSADLSGADLRNADLSGADLRSADLSGADLSSADLSGADLSSADLSSADLRNADLRNADLSGAPAIPALDSKILAAIDAGGKLNMGSWHSCETTHCRAGWAITLAGDEGRKLEEQYGSAAAGAMIYAKSYPDLRVPNFYATDDEAIEDMRARAATDPKEAA